MEQKYSGEERLLLVETLTEANAKAIEKIAKSLETLTNIVAKEDGRIKDLIHQLITDRDLCRQRQEHFVERLEAKQTLIIDIKRQIDSKADSDEVVAIKRILIRLMWGVLGGIGSILLALILIYIKKGAFSG